MTKLNFTKRALETLPLPRGPQRIYVYDEKVRGLGLALSAGGRRAFILYRKIQGRPERITIGPFPDLSIEQARGKAHQLNAAIALGENPASQRRAVSQQTTVGELFQEYLERHLKVHTRRSSADSDIPNPFARTQPKKK